MDSHFRGNDTKEQQVGRQIYLGNRLFIIDKKIELYGKALGFRIEKKLSI
jgi:hypothetical protein